MIIQEYNSKDKQAWDCYVLNHPKGVAYHLIAWKEAIKKAYGFKACYLMAYNASGKKLVGVFPLIYHQVPFLKSRFVSLPYCDAAGPLGNSGDIEKALLGKAHDYIRTGIVKELSLRSARPIPGIDKNLSKHKSKVRMVLDLPNNSDTLLASLKSKLRSQIKKPIRDGLKVEIGGKKMLGPFYKVFSENMQHLGSPVHSYKWVQSILDNYGNRAQLVIVRMPDQTPAAGGILLCHPNMVSVPWASSLRQFNRWNPNMLLYWTFLKLACDMGYPAFDFGRSTPNEGTYRFKKQWGANPKELHWHVMKPGSQLNLDDNNEQKFSKKALASWIIQSLPKSFAQFVGSNTRKYIDL